MTLLIDTNIMIDAITNRNPDSRHSTEVINLCSSGMLTGCVAPHSFSNMYYILRKDYSDEERRIIIRKYCAILKVVDINDSVMTHALDNNDITDFEDAIQYACADSVHADYIVTRNVKDYGNSVIKAVTPEDLLELLNH